MTVPVAQAEPTRAPRKRPTMTIDPEAASLLDESRRLLREKRLEVRETTALAVRSAITALDTPMPEVVEVELVETGQIGTVGSAKLRAAHAVGAQLEQELRELCTGVVAHLDEIGVGIESAADFQGARERTLALVGRMLPVALEAAHRMRLHRLDTATVQQSVDQIRTFVKQAIRELGEIEEEYAENVTAYGETIDTVLGKLHEATPKFIEAETRRRQLETDCQTAEMVLPNVAQAERPAQEAAFEALRRRCQEARLDEIEHMTIVTEAQRSVPQLQKNREAASRAIESIHGMRRMLLEKMENMTVVLAKALTAVRARARIARMEAVDPAFNRAFDRVTEHNIATAGAAMQVMIERLQHAAIDPERSRQLMAQLSGHIDDFLVGFNTLVDEAHAGTRRQLPPPIDRAQLPEVKDNGAR